MRAKMIFILPFAMGIAVWETHEFVHLCGAMGATVVEGDVIRRQEFRRFGGIPAGRLSIRIVGTDTVVIVETNKQAMRDLPERVRFRYTGDPKREVFVEGEEHRLGVALFLWVVSAGIAAYVIVPLLQRRNLSDAQVAPSETGGSA
jgi:hypothetical protein